VGPPFVGAALPVKLGGTHSWNPLLKNKNTTGTATETTEETEQPRVVIDFDVLRTYAAQNFRDLGGHPAANRRRVRAGRIFRSSHLAEVPPESPISRLKLRTLVTLQSRAEVKHLGAPAPASRRGVRWEHITTRIKLNLVAGPSGSGRNSWRG
jgi:hypothetical protein